MQGRQVVAVALLALAAVSAEKKSYRGYQIVRVHLQDDQDAEMLRGILDEDEEDETFNLLNEPGRGGFADVLTAHPTTLISLLRRSGVQNVEIADPDVAASIRREEELIEQRREEFSVQAEKGEERTKQFDLSNYHSIEEIYKHIFDLNVTQYPDITELVNIGQTYEDQDMWVLKICLGGCGSKPVMFLEAGIHAREWIGPATVLYMIDVLLNKRDTDADVNQLATDLDWYFLVVANPDGYRYSWTNDRNWRKTRSPNIGSRCVGVDPNRNFGVGWGGRGSSNRPCSSIYRGPSVFSERNTQNIRDYILTEKRAGTNFVYIQDFHSYSQMILYPWGYTSDLPPENDDLYSLGDIGETALFAETGAEYVLGPAATTIYPASGVVVDWCHKVAGVKYSYTMELRDKGRYGFLLPPDQIEPSGREMWAFHQALAFELIRRKFE